MTGRLDDNLVIHPFLPVADDDSRVLILGSLPSVMSRRQGFYYGNPQNRFWPLLSCLLEDAAPSGPDERRLYLLRHRIALWDVLRQCRITGSQDASIREPEVNDLPGLLARYPISCIFANGQTAARLYRQFCQPLTHRECVALPSTSPANGRWSLADLCAAWQPVRSALTAPSKIIRYDE